MKKILRIARIELNLLFYSPIAWLLLTIFTIITARTFLLQLDVLIQWQQLGKMFLPLLHNLTDYIFTVNGPGIKGLLPQGTDNLFWYIPLITMGLMSREISSGTVKLLYSSPLKVTDIILGKFLAMIVIDLVMVAIAGIMILIGLSLLQSPDVPLVLSGVTAMFLLIAAYSAIGLFVSCFTGYQVVAAIATFAIFGFLGYIGQFWQNMDLMRDLTAFLSINGRTDNFFRGLLVSTDLIYFLLIIFMFLAFSCFKLWQQREAVSALRQWGRYVGTFVLVLTIGYVASLPAFTWYADVTATRINTLTKGTQGLMRQIGTQPLEVNSYINILDEATAEEGLPKQRKADEQRWSLYTRFKPDMKFTYTYFYDSVSNPRFYAKYHGRSLKSIAQQVAQGFGLDINEIKTPEEIHKIVAMPLEQGRYCIQLKYKDRSCFLRLSDVDPYRFPVEPQIAAALDRLLAKKMPKYLFVQGEYERNPFGAGERDFGDFNKVWIRNALVNQGYETDTINLRWRDIPGDITGIVIADPRTDFDPAVRQKIQDYIDRGGNMMILGKIGKESITNPLIRQFGVQMTPGTLVQNSQYFGQDVVFPFMTGQAVSIQKTLAAQVPDSIALAFPGTTLLARTPNTSYHVIPLSITDPKDSWYRNHVLSPDSGTVRFSPDKGDRRGPFTTIVGVTRQIKGREQRIVISADADWLSNGTTGIPNKIWAMKSNNQLRDAAFGWMTNGAFPPDLSRPLDKDRHLFLNQTTYLRILLLWLMPGVMTLSAIILLLRRRRK